MEEKCPNCGSTELRKYGMAILSGGMKKQRHQCTKCGRTFTDEEEIEINIEKKETQ